MRRLARSGFAVALAAAVAACGSGARQKDNDVRIAFYSNPTSLTLIGNADVNSSQLASLISDGLVAYDAQSRYVPMVARSWELSPDGLTLTFHLRDDVLWHDGERVTSRDVKYTVAKAKDPASQARQWASSFMSVDSIDTPDDLTVVIHFATPYADVLEPWRVPLIPEHVVAKDSNFLNGAFAHHPIGCGPFRFVSFETGQSVVLSAFDRYWAGRPAMDRIFIKIVAAERTAYESLLMGNLDLLGVTPDVWRESLASKEAAPLSRFVYYKFNAWKIDWNLGSKVAFFQDKRVRRALMLALDRARFAATVSAGLARPGISSYPPESPWTDPSITAIPFDPVESARLLDEAGWRRASSGKLREKNGVPFSFTLIFPAGSQELADRSAAWIQQSLAEIGVDMKIEKLEGNLFNQRRKKGAFDAAMAALAFDATPDRYDLYHTKAQNGGFNYGGFSDAEVDQLLEAGRATRDPVARHDIYNRLQKRIDDLQPISFVFQFAQSVLHDAALEGVVPSSVGLLQFAPGPRAWRWSSAHARR